MVMEGYGYEIVPPGPSTFRPPRPPGFGNSRGKSWGWHLQIAMLQCRDSNWHNWAMLLWEAMENFDASLLRAAFPWPQKWRGKKNEKQTSDFLDETWEKPIKKLTWGLLSNTKKAPQVYIKLLNSIDKTNWVSGCLKCLCLLSFGSHLAKEKFQEWVIGSGPPTFETSC